MAYSGNIVEYLGCGIAADRPASLNLTPGALGIYHASDTDDLSLWVLGAWQSRGSGGGIPDAPSDGNTYGRKDGGWEQLADLVAPQVASEYEQRLEAVEAGQNAAMIGYATKSLMDANLVYPEGTLALVTNDPVPENNGTYRKTGASGTGSWVLSADRVTAVQQAQVSLEKSVGRAIAAQNDFILSDAGDVIPKPSRLRGLKAWWEISDLTTLFTTAAGSVQATVGSLVGRIEDKSGNGKHITFLDTYRPYLRQDSNGNYYLEGDGTVKYGTVANSKNYFKFLHDGTGMSFACAVAFEDQPISDTPRHVWHTNGSTTSLVGAGFQIVSVSGLGSSLIRIGNGSSSVINTGSANGDFRVDGNAQHVICTYKSQSGSDFHHYLDGAQRIPNGFNESNAPSSADAYGDFTLFSVNPAAYFSGKFYGLVISNVVWNEDERRGVGRYMMSLYDVATYTIGVGDSHTFNGSYGQYLRDFHPARLEAALRSAGYRRASVNKGISGNSTPNIITRIANVVEAGRGDIAVIYAGTNDRNAETTVQASPAPTATKFSVPAGKESYYSSGGQIAVGGVSATVLSVVGTEITLAEPLPSAPSAGAAVSIDTRANLITIGRAMQAAGYTKLVIGGQHYLNFASGGDTVATPLAGNAALRALQQSAADSLGALYVDFHAYMRDLIVAGTYTQGNDTAWHVAAGNTHLNNTGEQILADAIMAGMVSRGWV